MASGPLEPKIKEFICITVDAAATHLYVPGIREHIRQAIAHGATAQEIMEVLELTATLGIHACNIGVPILLEELEAAGVPTPRELSARQQELKEDFERKRGYWNDFWKEMLLLDADFFAAYTEFSSVPWISGTLEPKVKELVYTAFDVSATHLHAGPAPAHPQRARLRRDARRGDGGDRARQHDRLQLVRRRRADPRRGAREGRGVVSAATAATAGPTSSRASTAATGGWRSRPEPRSCSAAARASWPARRGTCSRIAARRPEPGERCGRSWRACEEARPNCRRWSPAPLSTANTERVRADAPRLRQEVWKVIPCEYVPCSIARGHGHAHEA